MNITAEITRYIELLRLAGYAWTDSVAVQFELDAGESGTVTIPAPAGLVTLYNEIREAGDRSCKWKCYIDATAGDENLAVAYHHVFNRTIPVLRKMEKYSYVYIVYENTDDENSAFFEQLVDATRANAQKWREEWKPALQGKAKEAFERYKE